MFHLRLFFKLFALNLKAQMEYRADFIVSIFQITLLQLGSLGLIWVVLDRFNGFTDFSSGVAIVAISSLTLGLHWTVVKILALIVVILGALLMQHILSPIDIYGKPIQILLAFVVPFAFVNFYPSIYFLDKSSAVLFHPALAYAAPLVGVLTFAVAYFIWKRGLRAYRSTGS